jgi:hypothetical protein
VRDDVGETRDLASARPDKVKELHGKLVAWRKEVGAVMPTMKTPDQLAAERSAPKKAQKKAGKGKEGDDEK